MIDLTLDQADRRVIDKIVERVAELWRRTMKQEVFDALACAMDLTAAHNHEAIDLDGLLNAEPFDFSHDVFGIMRHLDRETGELRAFFVPRHTKREPPLPAAGVRGYLAAHSRIRLATVHRARRTKVELKYQLKDGSTRPTARGVARDLEHWLDSYGLFLPISAITSHRACVYLRMAAERYQFRDHAEDDLRRLSADEEGTHDED